MSGALGYLISRSAANRVSRQAARLRTPRYLLALVLGAAWLGVIVWGQRPAPPDATAGAWLVPAGALLTLGIVVWIWISGGDKAALAFSPAEVTFLFPAPLERRTLVRYKLLRTQLLVLFNVAIWMIVAGRRPGLSPLLRACAIWTLITTLALHRMGAALVRTSLAQHGRFGLRHRVLSVALVLVAGAAIAWGLHDVAPGLLAAGRVGEPALRDAMGRALAHPALAIVLWPFRTMVRPLAADGAAEWRAAMLPALGLLALHYVWVMRSDAAFEEAAAEASLARARRRGAHKTSGLLVQHAGRAPSAPLFDLAPLGWPATALFWKNLAAVLRRRRARNIVAGLAAAGAVAAAISADPGNPLGAMAGALALTWLGFVAALGPQWIRNDLRGDLAHADLLRSYPLPGWAIVASETAASALTLTLLELVLAVFVYLCYLRDPSLALPPGERLGLLGAAAVLLPPVNFTALLLYNGAAVLFPAWVRIGATASGVEVLGQRLLTTTAFLVVLALLLTPPAAAAVGAYEVLAGALGGWALGPAFLAGLAVLAVEAALLVRRLGRAFERMDPAAIRA
ncbi:MAG: putative ABC exporter domain-containing protein [Deltaproteobacteria bacterium]